MVSDLNLAVQALNVSYGYIYFLLWKYNYKTFGANNCHFKSFTIRHKFQVFDGHSESRRFGI